MRALFFCLVFLNLSASLAVNLETLPTPLALEAKFSASLRSDIYLNPQNNKPVPIRVLNSDLIFPVFDFHGTKLYFTGSAEEFTTGIPTTSLGRNAVHVGSDLRSQRAGLAVDHTFSNDVFMRFDGFYASDSDEPYLPENSWIETHWIFYFPEHKGRRWVVLFDYSENRGYLNGKLVPLIGVHTDHNLQWSTTVGLPFLKINFQSPDWRAETVLTPTNLRGHIERTVGLDFTWGLGSGFQTRAYLHDLRPTDESRLYYEELYLQTYIKTPVSQSVSLNFILGTSGARKIYEAKQVHSPVGEKEYLPGDIYSSVCMEVAL